MSLLRQTPPHVLSSVSLWVLRSAWAAVALSLLIVACSDESLTPLPQDAGSGAAGVGGSGGEGGTAPASRGNPADFPTDCISDCVEACERLESCDASSSSLYAIESDECLERCALAEGGPLWGDISQHFKCCATQEACDAVQHCGGWLDHPDAVNSCDQLCGCFFSSPALAALAAGREAPHPYRFASHAVITELGDDSHSLAAVEHTLLRRSASHVAAGAATSGRFVEVRFTKGSGPHTVAALGALGRLLPTFVDNAGRLSAATGRLILRAPDASVLDAARRLTVRYTRSAPERTFAGRTLYSQLYADPWDALDALRDLAAAGIAAELDMVRMHRYHYTPNDPLFPDQWHLENGGQGPSTAGVDARVSEAWDVTLGDPAVIVAVNDDGLNLGHADFTDRLEPEQNFPSDWERLMAQGQFGGHGTSVSGVATAAADDQRGGAGACPGCRVMPHLLALTDGFGGFMLTDTGVAAGFERMVDAGAWVINNSWGLSLGDPLHAEDDVSSPPTPMVISEAFEYAETTGRGGLGTVIVYAAGNENTRVDYYSKHPLTVSVAAVGDLGLKSYYSSWGPEIRVGAPSNGALTGITTSSVGGGYTDSFGGTSSAAPLVTGIVGLIFSANPTLSAAEARDILSASATPIDPIFGDYQDGHSDYYGAGLVNAYVAVRMASGDCNDPSECQAPSDDCGASCGTSTACGLCRTQADCAPDHVCQALPSLGRQVCVAAAVGSCPNGTNLHNGYCVPLPETCGVCLGDEECNGRDDDCNGQADENDVCGGPPRCFIDSPPCPSGSVCGAVSCVPECDGDDDCEGGTQCRVLKNQYGTASGVKGCIQNLQSGCPLGCSVLASSLDDAALAEFVDCMMDGETSCNGAFACAGLLPVDQ
jgi:hypothetical protein